MIRISATAFAVVWGAQQAWDPEKIAKTLVAEAFGGYLRRTEDP
jgi:hypothetical protein